MSQLGYKASPILKDSWPRQWNQYNLLKKLKKRHDLTRVKISKFVTLILRPRYSHKKTNQNRLWNSIPNWPNVKW